MAIYNEILAGRLNRALTKFLSMKGPAPAPALGSEIMPVIPFFWGVEDRFLEGWNRFAVSASVAAVAANVSLFQFTNAAGSGVVAVFEKINLANPNAATINGVVSNQIPAAAAQVNAFPLAGTALDQRGNPAPSITASNKNNTATNGTGNNFYSINLASNAFADVIQTDNQEVTLLPGSSLQVWFATVNSVLTFSVMWRERPLEDSETKQ